MEHAELRHEPTILGAASVHAGCDWRAAPIIKKMSHPELRPVVSVFRTLDHVVGCLTANPEPDLAALARVILCRPVGVAGVGDHDPQTAWPIWLILHRGLKP